MPRSKLGKRSIGTKKVDLAKSAVLNSLTKIEISACESVAMSTADLVQSALQAPVTDQDQESRAPEEGAESPHSIADSKPQHAESMPISDAEQPLQLLAKHDTLPSMSTGFKIPPKTEMLSDDESEKTMERAIQRTASDSDVEEPESEVLFTPPSSQRLPSTASTGTAERVNSAAIGVSQYTVKPETLRNPVIGSVWKNLQYSSVLKKSAYPVLSKSQGKWNTISSAVNSVQQPRSGHCLEDDNEEAVASTASLGRRKDPHSVRKVKINSAVELADTASNALKELWHRLHSLYRGLLLQPLPKMLRGRRYLISSPNAHVSEMMFVKGVSLSQLNKVILQCIDREGSRGRSHWLMNQPSWAWWTHPLKYYARYAPLRHQNLSILFGVLSCDLPKIHFFGPGTAEEVPSSIRPPTNARQECETKNSVIDPPCYLYIRRDEGDDCAPPLNGMDVFRRLHNIQSGEVTPLPDIEKATVGVAGLPNEDSLSHQLADFLWQLICGVRFLHHHQLIHGNVKPSNMIVFSDGHVVLTDFGLPMLPEELTEVDSQMSFASYVRVRDGRPCGGYWCFQPYLRIRDSLLAKQPSGRSLASDSGSSSSTTFPSPVSSMTDYFTSVQPFMAPECMLMADGKLYVNHAALSPASDAYGVGALIYWLYHGKYPPLPAYPVARRVATLGSAYLSKTQPPNQPMPVFTAPMPRFHDASQRDEAVAARGSTFLPSSRLTQPEDASSLPEFKDDGSLDCILQYLLQPDPAKRMPLGHARSFKFLCRYGAHRHELKALKERHRQEWLARKS